MCGKIFNVPAAVFYILQPTKGTDIEEKINLVERHSKTSRGSSTLGRQDGNSSLLKYLPWGFKTVPLTVGGRGTFHDILVTSP